MLPPAVSDPNTEADDMATGLPDESEAAIVTTDGLPDAPPITKALCTMWLAVRARAGGNHRVARAVDRTNLLIRAADQQAATASLRAVIDNVHSVGRGRGARKIRNRAGQLERCPQSDVGRHAGARRSRPPRC